jgi:spore germination cell wall hydrolase CwlJ-like protein
MDPRVCQEQFMLALAIWREARGEPVNAQIAVGCSIRNRTLRATWWNDRTAASYTAVILQPYQYSSFNASDPNATKIPNYRDPNFREILGIAASIIDGTQEDTTSGATHYFDSSIDPPSWTTEMTEVLDLPPFKFFK